MKCIENFENLYMRSPDGVSFCPYRICPIGAHSDQQHGKITGFAIDKGIHIAYGVKKNGIVEVFSLQFNKRAQFHLQNVPKTKDNDWADYLRGSVVELAKKYNLTTGLCCVIDGSLPIGGLSSSAAVTIAFLCALCKVNGIVLSPNELILTAMRAENEYVGVACGKLDQSCEVYSKKDHLLYLDTLDDSYELIPTNPSMKAYEIAIFFSGIERTLSGTKFNMRVDECRSAAYALKAFSGMEYGEFNETYLRDVPREVFEQYKHKLPENWRKRADHWYSEFNRVVEGAQAWRRGDIDTYGKLCFESGNSSILSWETGSPELVTLYNLLKQTDGVYGGRFSGAGFKGCCMALIDPAYRESIEETVTKGYLKEFPALEGKYSVHFCQSADGVGLL